MKLTQPIAITVQQAVSLTTDTITINSLVDDQKSVTAEVTINYTGTQSSPFVNNRKRLVLWNSTSTPTYSSVGDWTQAQAEAQIATLLGGTLGSV